jgi:hypothetical protein
VLASSGPESVRADVSARGGPGRAVAGGTVVASVCWGAGWGAG